MCLTKCHDFSPSPPGGFAVCVSSLITFSQIVLLAMCALLKSILNSPALVGGQAAWGICGLRQPAHVSTRGPNCGGGHSIHEHQEERDVSARELARPAVYLYA